VVAADSSAVARCSSASRRAAARSSASSTALSTSQGGAAGDLLEEHPVVVVVRRGGGLAAQREDGEQPAADGQRHRHGRQQAVRPPRLRAVEGRIQPGQPCAQYRPAGGQHVETQAAVRVEAGQRCLARAVQRGDPGEAQPAVVPQQPHAAQVGQPPLDQQPRQRTQLAVDGGLPVQRGADLGQQRLPGGLAGAGVDVGAAADIAGGGPTGADGPLPIGTARSSSQW
jgi:hypothetical protein